MKKKIFRYFVGVIGIAVAVTTVLLVWLSYSMFENRVIDDLRAQGRMLGRLIEESGEEQALALQQEEMRITLIRADGTVAYDLSLIHI